MGKVVESQVITPSLQRLKNSWHILYPLALVLLGFLECPQLRNGEYHPFISARPLKNADCYILLDSAFTALQSEILSGFYLRSTSYKPLNITNV